MVDNAVFEVMQAFPKSFINQNGEFIAHEEANLYFNMATCKDDTEIKCKVLEWFSRDAFKTCPYHGYRKNLEYQKLVADGINKFLGTEFTRDDFEKIYTELGNSTNRELTLGFIQSGYDMKILREEKND